MIERTHTHTPTLAKLNQSPIGFVKRELNRQTDRKGKKEYLDRCRILSNQHDEGLQTEDWILFHFPHLLYLFFCCVCSLVCGCRHLVYKARVQLTCTRIPSSYPCLPHPNMVLSNAPIPPLSCLCTTPKKESVDSIVQYVVSS